MTHDPTARDHDTLAREYPEYRRLLAAANRAAAFGDPAAYRAAHAAVLAWEPPQRASELTEHERRVHAAFTRAVE